MSNAVGMTDIFRVMIKINIENILIDTHHMLRLAILIHVLQLSNRHQITPSLNSN